MHQPLSNRPVTLNALKSTILCQIIKSVRSAIIFTDSKCSAFTQCLTTEKRLVSLKSLAFSKTLTKHKHLTHENLSNINLTHMTRKSSSNNLSWYLKADHNSKCFNPVKPSLQESLYNYRPRT